MFNRDLQKHLGKWKIEPSRKPLVVRGARQVGKTTVISQFAKNFGQYIYLNLELPEDRQPFEKFTNIETLLQAIFFLKNKSLSQKQLSHNKDLNGLSDVDCSSEASVSLRPVTLMGSKGAVPSPATGNRHPAEFIERV